MSINFAGEAPKSGTHDLTFFDRRYLNTDEKIPQVDRITVRVKTLERKTHQQQLNIDDFRIKFAQGDAKIDAVKGIIETKLSAVDRKLTSHETLVNALVRSHRESETTNRTLTTNLGKLDDSHKLHLQRTKILEENYETERGKLSRLKENFDAKIGRMSMLELENILERMTAIERNMQSKSAAFDAKVDELNRIHQNFRRLTQQELDVIKATIAVLLKEMDGKAEKPIYRKVLEEIMRKLN